VLFPTLGHSITEKKDHCFHCSGGRHSTIGGLIYEIGDVGSNVTLLDRRRDSQAPKQCFFMLELSGTSSENTGKVKEVWNKICSPLQYFKLTVLDLSHECAGQQEAL